MLETWIIFRTSWECSLDPPSTRGMGKYSKRLEAWIPSIRVTKERRKRDSDRIRAMSMDLRRSRNISISTSSWLTWPPPRDFYLGGLVLSFLITMPLTWCWSLGEETLHSQVSPGIISPVLFRKYVTHGSSPRRWTWQVRYLAKGTANHDLAWGFFSKQIRPSYKRTKSADCSMNSSNVSVPTTRPIKSSHHLLLVKRLSNFLISHHHHQWTLPISPIRRQSPRRILLAIHYTYSESKAFNLRESSQLNF